MLNFLISILIGIIPDVIFLTFFITQVKDEKEKRFTTLILILISYVLCFTIKRYNVLYYALSVGLIYGVLKGIYKEKIKLMDIIIITLAEAYILTCSYISFKIFGNQMEYYYLALIIDKILILLPLLFSKKTNQIYKRYQQLWDRNSIPNRNIKSITVRNLSIVGLCIVFMAAYQHLLMII